MIKHSVDLKWALWSKDLDYWTDYRKDGPVIQDMHAAFLGLGPAVTIHTSPKKEIRYGSVMITKGKADGHFTCEWDGIEDLANTLGLIDEDGHWIDRTGMDEKELAEQSQDYWDDLDRQAFADSIPFSQYTWEPGVDRDFEVTAESFEELMEKIDDEEAALLKEDQEQWKLIEEIYKQK